MRLTRRRLLASTLAAPLAVKLPGDAEAAIRASADIGSRALFEPLVGDDFVLRDGDAVHPARLTAVHELAQATDRERCFALEFTLAGPARPGQATFDVVHPALPRFAALAAPSNATGERLVAVFNNPR